MTEYGFLWGVGPKVPYEEWLNSEPFVEPLALCGQYCASIKDSCCPIDSRGCLLIIENPQIWAVDDSMYSKDFSLILIIKDDYEALQCALNSLNRLDYPKEHFEVIVIDDGSDPKIAEKIPLDYDFDCQLKYLPREACSSRARARNKGAALAKYEQLVFMDGDHFVEPRFLQKYCNYFTYKPREQVVLSTRRQIPADYRHSILSRSAELDDVLRIPQDNDIRLRVCQILNKPFYQLAGHWHLFWSCNFCIKKSLYQQLCGFDEDFLEWGLEDSEFGYRLFKAGVKIDLLDNYVWHIPALKAFNGAAQYRAWMNNIGVFYSKHPYPEVLAQMTFEDIYFNQQGLSSQHKNIDWVERYLEFDEKVNFFASTSSCKRKN